MIMASCGFVTRDLPETAWPKRETHSLWAYASELYPTNRVSIARRAACGRESLESSQPSVYSLAAPRLALPAS